MRCGNKMVVAHFDKESYCSISLWNPDFVEIDGKKYNVERGDRYLSGFFEMDGKKVILLFTTKSYGEFVDNNSLICEELEKKYVTIETDEIVAEFITDLDRSSLEAIVSDVRGDDDLYEEKKSYLLEDIYSKKKGFDRQMYESSPPDSITKMLRGRLIGKKKRNLEFYESPLIDYNKDYLIFNQKEEDKRSLLISIIDLQEQVIVRRVKMPVTEKGENVDFYTDEMLFKKKSKTKTKTKTKTKI